MNFLLLNRSAIYDFSKFSLHNEWNGFIIQSGLGFLTSRPSHCFVKSDNRRFRLPTLKSKVKYKIKQAQQQ